MKKFVIVLVLAVTILLQPLVAFAADSPSGSDVIVTVERTPGQRLADLIAKDYATMKAGKKAAPVAKKAATEEERTESVAKYGIASSANEKPVLVILTDINKSKDEEVVTVATKVIEKAAELEKDIQIFGGIMDDVAKEPKLKKAGVKVDDLKLVEIHDIFVKGLDTSAIITLDYLRTFAQDEITVVLFGIVDDNDEVAEWIYAPSAIDENGNLVVFISAELAAKLENNNSVISVLSNK